MSERKPIRKAVIPAAGFGTRFLPATKSQPKEMLPIVDTPVIQYVVEEAVKSGITDILMVIGKGKRAIERTLRPQLPVGESTGTSGQGMRIKSDQKDFGDGRHSFRLAKGDEGAGRCRALCPSSCGG